MLDIGERHVRQVLRTIRETGAAGCLLRCHRLAKRNRRTKANEASSQLDEGRDTARRATDAILEMQGMQLQINRDEATFVERVPLDFAPNAA